jgi:hypothetical protein
MKNYKNYWVTVIHNNLKIYLLIQKMHIASK